MSVEFVGQSIVHESNAASGSFSVTIPEDATGCLISTHAWDNNHDEYITALNFDNGSTIDFPTIVVADWGSDGEIELAFISAASTNWPGTGTHTIYYSLTGTMDEGMVLLCTFYKGIDLTDPVAETLPVSVGAGNTTSLDVDFITTPTSGDLCIAYAGGYGALVDADPDSDQTVVYESPVTYNNHAQGMVQELARINFRFTGTYLIGAGIILNAEQDIPLHSAYCIYPTGYTLSQAESLLYPPQNRYNNLASFAGLNLSLDRDIYVDIIWGDETTNWMTVGPDVSNPSFSGWTHNGYKIVIKAVGNARHPGYCPASPTHWRHRPATGHAWTLVSLILELIGLDIENQSGGISDECFRLEGGNNNLTVNSCIGGFTTRNDQQDFIYTNQQDYDTVLIINCAIKNIYRSVYGNYAGSYGTARIYNSSFYNCAHGSPNQNNLRTGLVGISNGNSLTVDVKNVLYNHVGSLQSHGLVIALDGGSLLSSTVSNLITSASSIDNAVTTDCTTDATFADDTSAQAVIFESLTSGSEDFHLVDHANNIAIGAGIGPDSDSDIPLYDIDGDERTGITTDVGADLLIITSPSGQICFLTDISVLSESSGAIAKYLAGYSDSVSLGSNINSIAKYLKAIIESVFITGDTYSSAKYIADINESIIVSSIVDVIVQNSANLTDIISLIDADSALIAHISSLLDDMLIGSNPAGISKYISATIDSLSIIHDELAISKFISGLDDLLSILSDRQSLAKKSSQLNDSIIYDDDTTISVSLIGGISDQLNLIDSNGSSLRQMVALYDSISLFNDYLFQGQQTGQINDVLKYIEVKNIVRKMLSDISDNISITELSQIIGKYICEDSGTMHFADNIFTILTKRAEIIDAISLGDGIGLNNAAALIDGLMFNDIEIGTIHFQVQIDDALSLIDQKLALAKYAMEIVNELGLQDQIADKITIPVLGPPLATFVSKKINFIFSTK